MRSRYPPRVVQSRSIGGATIIGSSTAGPRTGPAERCSPSTSVVTPCDTLLSARGSTTSPYSEWACMSMKPGASTSPAASSTSAAGGWPAPTSTMVSPATARFARNQGPPAPSTTRAPRIRRSGSGGVPGRDSPQPENPPGSSSATAIPRIRTAGGRAPCIEPSEEPDRAAQQAVEKVPRAPAGWLADAARRAAGGGVRGGSSLPAKEGRSGSRGRFGPPSGGEPRIRPDDGVPHLFENGFPCGALYPKADSGHRSAGSPALRADPRVPRWRRRRCSRRCCSGTGWGCRRGFPTGGEGSAPARATAPCRGSGSRSRTPGSRCGGRSRRTPQARAPGSKSWRSPRQHGAPDSNRLWRKAPVRRRGVKPPAPEPAHRKRGRKSLARRCGAKRRRGRSSLPAKEGGTDRAGDSGRHPVGAPHPPGRWGSPYLRERIPMLGASSTGCQCTHGARRRSATAPGRRPEAGMESPSWPRRVPSLRRDAERGRSHPLPARRRLKAPAVDLRARLAASESAAGGLLSRRSGAAPCRGSGSTRPVQRRAQTAGCGGAPAIHGANRGRIARVRSAAGHHPGGNPHDPGQQPWGTGVRRRRGLTRSRTVGRRV